jgi:hypothetical protein
MRMYNFPPTYLGVLLMSWKCTLTKMEGAVKRVVRVL